MLQRDAQVFEQSQAAEALMAKAEAALQQRLAQHPTDAQALRSLGLLARKQGQLARAATWYRTLVASGGTPADRRLAAILDQQETLPPRPAGRQAAPYVLIPNFLPDDLYAQLLPYVHERRQDFVSSKVGRDPTYNPDYRTSMTLRAPKGEQDWWGMATRIRARLPHLYPRLELAPFPLESLSVKMAVYQHGHYFKPHADNGFNRRISYVYFFYREPKAFTGGDLLLFDSDLDANSYTQAQYTRVTPQANSIIFFHSPYYHTVTPVTADPDDFGAGRFVIHGHLTEQVDGAAVG